MALTKFTLTLNETGKKVSKTLEAKEIPKIILVNGQWNIADSLPFGDNFGPTQPKKPYWVQGMAKRAIEYFIFEFKLKEKFKLNGKRLSIEELEKKKYILYYDGSSKWGGDQSGSDRFNNGKKFAEENYDEITNGLGKESIYLVSHSEGGAYASGIADYLFEKGHTIGEHVLLSPDEGDEFEINPAIPSYQLLYMFFSDSISNMKWIRGFRGLKFKKWDSYYAIVDWVVNEHKVKGVRKMGIVHKQKAGWTGVHGWTNGYNVFKEVSDLKVVQTFLAIGEHEGNFYSGQDHTISPKGTKFYRIDDKYIITNCPPLIKIK